MNSDLLTHPVFVVSHVAEDIVQVEDAAVAVLQPVNLQPVAGILKDREKGDVNPHVNCSVSFASPSV